LNRGLGPGGPPDKRFRLEVALLWAGIAAVQFLRQLTRSTLAAFGSVLASQEHLRGPFWVVPCRPEEPGRTRKNPDPVFSGFFRVLPFFSWFSGHVEKYEHRIDHMERLRSLQDETGGFNTFIPLKFRNKGNQMSHIAEVSVIEDLRNYAVARLYLDNFAHIKAYWPMIGRSTAQLSLSYGVNDLDGTIDDTTKIYSMAGSEEHSPSLSTEELIALISETGRVAVERDTVYNVIRNYSEQPLEAETTSNP
jgi:hypothetical protein